MINNLLQALASHLGVSMYAKGQAGTRPTDTVYGEYEVFNTDFANPNQWVRSQEEAVNDMVEITSEGQVSYSVQLNFLYGGEDTAQMNTIINCLVSAWLWLQFNGKSTLEALNVVVTNISKDIQRRYDTEATSTEMKAGLDFYLKSVITYISEVERIKDVDWQGHEAV